MNRQAAVTISASIPGDYPIGDAMHVLEQAAHEEIGDQAMSIDYTGQARQFRQATGAIGFAFAFALIIVYLVLAAQFESFVHPFVIMVSVPLALMGGLFGLFLFDYTLNIYSQIGLIILIALAGLLGLASLHRKAWPWIAVFGAAALFCFASPILALGASETVRLTQSMQQRLQLDYAPLMALATVVVGGRARVALTLIGGAVGAVAIGFLINLPWSLSLLGHDGWTAIVGVPVASSRPS